MKKVTRAVRFSAAALIASGAVISTVTNAETLAVANMSPAGHSGAGDVHTITVEEFRGPDGAALSFAVERALQGARIDGQPYFQISTDADRTEAMLSGIARLGVDEFEEFQPRTKCVKKDPQNSNSCLETREIKVICTKKIISLTSSVRLASQVNGRVLYSADKNDRDENVFCPDQSNNQSTESLVQAMIDRAAASVRTDMAPVQRISQIDIQERSSGIPKALRKAFKNAIKLTKRDDSAACAAFADLYTQAPQARSLIYNNALCAERVGDLARADELLRIAAPMYRLSGTAEAGMRRVAQTDLALQQIAQRPAR